MDNTLFGGLICLLLLIVVLIISNIMTCGGSEYFQSYNNLGMNAYLQNVETNYMQIHSLDKNKIFPEIISVKIDGNEIPRNIVRKRGDDYSVVNIEFTRVYIPSEIIIEVANTSPDMKSFYLQLRDARDLISWKSDFPFKEKKVNKFAIKYVVQGSSEYSQEYL
jgi:hypothetical protein